MHNILFYLHTDIISFSTDLTCEPPSDRPKLCDAEEIYAMADRLLLDDLKTKAFEFLKLTCDIRNITRRAMGKYATIYPDLGEMYAAYYRKNLAEVRSTKEHDEFFAERESEPDATELVQLIRRYREIMETAKWVIKT